MISSRAPIARIGLALAALNFVVIAVCVSNVNPRAGRGGNMMFALFSFVIYYNLLNLGQNWIGSGQMSIITHMLALHGGVFLLAVLSLTKGHNNWSWPRLMRAKR